MPDDYLKSCWIWICGNVVAYNPAVRIPPEHNICYFQFNCYYCVCHRNVNRTKVNKKKSELDETLTPFFPLQIWFCSLPEVDEGGSGHRIYPLRHVVPLRKFSPHRSSGRCITHNISLVSSVTRWLDYVFNIWPFRAMEINLPNRLDDFPFNCLPNSE